MFAISGSNWTSESNNVSCLYSYDGNLLGTIWSKKEIEDEMVFYIFDKTSERFVESHDDTEWQCYEQFLDKLTQPLPAKAGRFDVLLKQPKVRIRKVIFFPLLLILFQSYQSCSSPVRLGSEYTL